MQDFFEYLITKVAFDCLEFKFFIGICAAYRSWRGCDAAAAAMVNPDAIEVSLLSKILINTLNYFLFEFFRSLLNH